jgi:hypothetical protein
VRDALTRESRLGRSIMLQAWEGDIGVRALRLGVVVSRARTSPTRLGRGHQEACVIQTARDAPLAGAGGMLSVQLRSRNPTALPCRLRGTRRIRASTGEGGIDKLSLVSEGIMIDRMMSVSSLIRACTQVGNKQGEGPPGGVRVQKRHSR